MNNNIFNLLAEMNVDDMKKATHNVAVSPYFLRSQKTNQGGEITMGIASESFEELLNDKVMSLLIIINKDEYNKIKAKYE